MMIIENMNMYVHMYVCSYVCINLYVCIYAYVVREKRYAQQEWSTAIVL